MSLNDEQWYTEVTSRGLAAEVLAKAQGNAYNVTHIAIGDSNGESYNPTPEQLALKNELHRLPIQSLTPHANNPTWLVFEAYVPEDIGGFTINEAALIGEDGTLYAIAKLPPSYKPLLENGAAKGVWLRLILQQTSHKNITVLIDPSVVLATREYVDEAIDRLFALQIAAAAERVTIQHRQIQFNERLLRGGL
ncbi:MAG: phage tail protein [Oceanospirillaceae bacterium]|nr:phage tail protein [Oceanospirillaceae bacterium]